MIYLKSFIFCGLVSALAELILSKTKLTPGHMTTLFVIIGSFLDVFDIYDKLITWAGGGALVPITSFGHLLIHGAMENAMETNFMGLLTGMLNLTAAGITSAIIISFYLSLIFKPKD